MSWTTHFLNLCDWYIHLLCASPTKSIHFHVFDNITSNSNTSTTSSRPSSTTILRACLSLLSDKHRVLYCFFSRAQVGRQFRPHIQAISTTSNVTVAAHMKTKAIPKYWFGEEAEGSDRSGGQCGHGDDREEEEGDDNDNDGVMRNIMEIGREQCRLQIKEIRDHFVSC
ncbi:hypothetical protein Ahy_A06g029343 [Arachis hypogaea]|uniref:Uncharacterized protein n=1 Tax=Arachis hypogaea TaxID=3818 RepID=A0A445CSX8_ARAHY|nr:hypothetical protein Ahy_A06g029343 [Arachis hypogaea]